MDLSAGLGIMGGEIAYEIGRSIIIDGEREALPFPISRLEWPIDVPMAEFDTVFRFSERFELRGRFAFSLADNAGTMADYDWDYPDGRRVLSIYSESDTVLDAWTSDVVLRWWAWRQPRAGAGELALGMGLGWLHQDYAWEARDGVQSYPSEPDVPPDRWEGTAITYDLDVDFPYLEFCARARQDPITVEGRIAWSPFVSADDRDVHVLRDILAETDADGSALLAEASLRWDFAAAWYLRFRAQYAAFRADGPSHTLIYGPAEDPDLEGERWTIHEKLRSAQVMMFLALGLRL